MKLSILVPAFDESATVEIILRRLAELPLDKEIILVDDGSRDDTYERARALCPEIPELRVLRQENNQGKGAAIRRALAEASGEVVVVQDADLEYEPGDIVRLYEELCARDLAVIYGSRRLGGRSAAFRRRYYYGGAFLSAFTNLLYGSHLSDEPTCYKMIRTDLLRSLELRCEGFEFCPEVTAKILRRGIEIPEIQISYHPRSLAEGKKIRLRDALQAAWVLFALRYQRARRPPGVDPAPGDKVLAPLAALALLVLAFAGVFFGGRSLLASAGMPGVVYERIEAHSPPPPPVMDSVSAYIDEPLAVAISRQVGAGRAPLWNPDNGAGAPLLGNMQSAPLSPLRWPLLLLPDRPWLGDVTLLVRLLIAGLFTYLLVRSRRASIAAGIGAAATFMLSGYFVLHVSMHHLNIEVLLPALLYYADRVGRAERVRRRDFLALVAVCWMSIVGGNPEATMVVLLFSACFVLAHLHRWGASRLVPLGGAVLFAVGLAMPYILPAIEYLQMSAHHHGAGTGLDHYRLWMGLAYFAPGAFAPSAGGVDPIAPAYLGAAALGLASLGLRRGRSELPVRLFACGAALVLLKSLGAPLINDVGRLPLLNLLIFFKYASPVLALCVAGLVAAAIDRLGAPADADRRGPPWRVLGPALVLALAWGLYLLARSRPEARAALVSVHLDARSLAFGAAVLLLALAHGLRAFPYRRALAWTGCALVAGELVAAAHLARPPRRDPCPEVGYADFLKERIHRARSERAGIPRCFGPDGSLPPNVNAALGIPDIRLHDGLYVERYALYVHELLCPNARAPQFDGRFLRRLPAAQVERARRISAFHLERELDQRYFELWRSGRDIDLARPSDALGFELAGVRYHLVHSAGWPLVQRLLAQPGQHWRIVYPTWLEGLPLEKLAIDQNLRRLAGELAGGDLLVLEDDRALPQAYLVERVLSSSSPGHSVELLKQPGFRPREQAVLEGAAPRELLGARAGAPAGSVEILAQHPDEIHLRTRSARPALLVLLGTFYPGWTAEIDGEPAVIQPANLLFRGVPLPAGNHQVIFRYQPNTWRYGLWIALLAGFGLIAWGFLVGRREVA